MPIVSLGKHLIRSFFPNLSFTITSIITGLNEDTPSNFSGPLCSVFFVKPYFCYTLSMLSSSSSFSSFIFSHNLSTFAMAAPVTTSVVELPLSLNGASLTEDTVDSLFYLCSFLSFDLLLIYFLSFLESLWLLLDLDLLLLPIRRKYLKLL